jgi:two-component system, OmpR family, phosphate regulon sensor histidine kinase PhoR
MILAFGSIFVYLDKIFYKDYLERVKTNIVSQTSVLKKQLKKTQIKTYLLQGFSKEFGEVFGSRISIINEQGVVLADSYLSKTRLQSLENHSNREELKDAKKNSYGWSQRFSTTIKKDVLYYAEPFSAKKLKGFVRVSVPIENLSVISKNFGKSLSVILIFIFISSLFIALIAFNIISKPIRRLVQKAEEIAAGNFSIRIPVNKKDEVGELAESLNKMSKNIRHRIRDIINNNSKFETVLLSMFEGVMVIDSNGVIQLMNDSLKKMMNIKTDPCGKKPIELIKNIVIQNLSEEVSKINDREVITKEELLLPDKKTVIIHASPIFNKDYRLGAVLVFNDITELRKLERLRTDFVANASHELRTPVSNIRGYAETLLDGAITDKDNAKDFVDVIYSEAKRLSMLINDILDISKLESDLFNINIDKDVSLKELVEEAVLGFDKDLKMKGINIVNEVEESVRLNIDTSLIIQVIINLIDNAIKYSSNDTVIKVSSEAYMNKYIKVDIIDQGIGIPEKDIKRIFERFYRVDKSRSKNSGGTGLGLSIVKHIVQAHGGEVFVESKKDLGSKFSFTIPA